MSSGNNKRRHFVIVHKLQIAAIMKDIPLDIQKLLSSSPVKQPASNSAQISGLAADTALTRASDNSDNQQQKHHHLNSGNSKTKEPEERQLGSSNGIQLLSILSTSIPDQQSGHRSGLGETRPVNHGNGNQQRLNMNASPATTHLSTPVPAEADGYFASKQQLPPPFPPPLVIGTSVASESSDQSQSPSESQWQLPDYRVAHRNVERRRRESINHSIDTLNSLIMRYTPNIHPSVLGDIGTGSYASSKGSVLKRTVRIMDVLMRENMELKQALRNLQMENQRLMHQRSIMSPPSNMAMARTQFPPTQQQPSMGMQPSGPAVIYYSSNGNTFQ